MSILSTSIEYLKGVGPSRAELLKKEFRIFKYSDLLDFYPFRYVDRSRYFKTNEINSETPMVQLRGKLGKVEMLGKARQQRLVAEFKDEFGSIDLVWFKGARFIKPTLKPDVEYVVFGKPNFFNQRINIAHPELSVYESGSNGINASLQPVYSTTEKLSGRGLNSKGVEKLQRNLIPQIWEYIHETLSPEVITDLNLMSRKQALRQIHFPEDHEKLQKAIVRLKFEELFFIQLQLLRTQLAHKAKFKGFVFESIGNNFNDFYNNKLPFELTGAQKRVLKEIRKDFGSGVQMNRLMQGDVGSGKTIVALMCALMALDNGFQTSIMAPTEILATQHFEGITELLEGMGVTVALLTGSTKTAVRRTILTDLEEGELDIIIGTHALIEDRVKFKNIGLSIIDEQHRFGVAQRSKLWQKNTRPPHVLVMTATPIPRTLSMTLYGDLDISVIDELPPGRKAIRTEHRSDSHRLRVFQFMKNEIAKGRQVYVVYPLIQESEKLDYKDLMDGYEGIARAFPNPEYQVAIVHGKMKPKDKDFEMQRFASGQAQILVATTVIEVGVNVPNASVMVIESAERFGLSQLHQLRGRVGRGADQSFCILMTGHKLSNESKKRMEIMVRTNDGFEIAEEDLRLRGPGDMMGTQQSGILDLKLADLAKDQQILLMARNKASQILTVDPNLQLPENLPILNEFKLFLKTRPNWSRIS
ncbi:MAG: ATP-dependent DNA helicase RecG [Salibacteraceae bacterium]